MTLIAAASGISLTLQHGVNGSLINEKAKPDGSKYLRPEQLGCWRAHANVWRRIISENIETALILEDDVDWDINIRDVFADLGHHMSSQKIFKQLLPRTTPEAATYGSGWDILYVGSSSNIPNLNDLPPYYLYHDPHVPDYHKLARSYRRELEVWGINATELTHVRLLAPSWYPVGALGYAITKRAAQILLYNLGGYRGLQLPVDLAMIGLIQKGIVNSYTIIPPLITPFRVGGAKDSDIDEKRYIRGDLPPGSENLKSS
ncbi:uncharacterized protein N7473_000205, partial [Penicillium subrubescens]|uniref:uncharacterized protein n=1 Tax=Penicillium subrubescens TaxID=1316194 RepID=UPI0025451E21